MAFRAGPLYSPEGGEGASVSSSEQPHHHHPEHTKEVTAHTWETNVASRQISKSLNTAHTHSLPKHCVFLWPACKVLVHY